MNTVTFEADRAPADPRIARSEATIRAALLGLLADGRSFESLTVSEVAGAAGVTRKTFYARFGSLEGVVQRVVADLFTAIVEQLDDDVLRLPRTDRWPRPRRDPPASDRRAPPWWRDPVRGW